MAVRVTGRLKAYRLFWGMAVGVLLLDQVSKLWIDSVIPFGTYFFGQGPGRASPIVVIPDFFQLVHIGNEGAAWGILSGYRLLLVLIAVGALLAIYFYRGPLELKRVTMQFSFGMIVGGIVGNLLDRMIYGHVVDFLDFHLPGIAFLGIEPYRWPAFNVADMGISCGVILYLILSFWPQRNANADSSPDQDERSAS